MRVYMEYGGGDVALLRRLLHQKLDLSELLKTALRNVLDLKARVVLVFKYIDHAGTVPPQRARS